MIHVKSLLGVLFAAVLVLAIAAPAAMADSTVPLPSLAKAFKGTQCVEPADVMRRQHMTFLDHQRDETMRQGIRGNKYSLQQCIDCHATADPKIMDGSVRTLQPFCGECHAYAAVNIDCFSCHNPTTPLQTSGNAPLDKMIAAHMDSKKRDSQ